MRARIDVSEIEAQTKIRAKYLRALENEEWGLLPGPTFVKSFLRTYAQALGLDGKALVEEYRLHHERASEAFEPIVPARSPRRPPHQGPSRGYIAAVSVIGAVILILIIALLAGGGGGGGSGTASSPPKATAEHHAAKSHKAPSKSAPASGASAVVALSLHATGAVYVCLVGATGHELIPGIELHPGESTPTFHSRRFLITLGNSAVTMIIDGRPRSVAPSSQAIGYSVTKARGRQPLAPGQLPTCVAG